MCLYKQGEAVIYIFFFPPIIIVIFLISFIYLYFGCVETRRGGSGVSPWSSLPHRRGGFWSLGAAPSGGRAHPRPPAQEMPLRNPSLPSDEGGHARGWIPEDSWLPCRWLWGRRSGQFLEEDVRDDSPLRCHHPAEVALQLQTRGKNCPTSCFL